MYLFDGLRVGDFVVGELELIDARAGDVRNADLIFIFGTRHWTPAGSEADCHELSARARSSTVASTPKLSEYVGG